MSRCISAAGEYSDHELATSGPAIERFTCRLCGALAEDELLAAFDAADAALARVREAHPREDAHNSEWFDGWCPTCQTPWPCRTLKALDGTDEASTDGGETDG